MDHAQQLSRTFPWRTATLVTAAVAALELGLLVVGGASLLARPFHHSGAAAKPPAAAHAAGRTARPVLRLPRQAVAVVPLRPRSSVSVLVLNGNGVQGAASAEATRLQTLGYRIGGATNAIRHDYARSMVMYAPGYGSEARRLAHDTGIQMVAPADGASRASLKASPLVVLLGN